jgi:hypothetical protein
MHMLAKLMFVTKGHVSGAIYDFSLFCLKSIFSFTLKLFIRLQVNAMSSEHQLLVLEVRLMG